MAIHCLIEAACMTQKRPAVSASPANASVNPPAPANGIVGASAPLVSERSRLSQRTRLGRVWSAMKSAIDRRISLRPAHAWASSAAISSVTSRDQPSAVLKATIRTGSSHCPSRRSWISFVRLASVSSVSRPDPAENAKMVQHEIDVAVGIFGHDRRGMGHHATLQR